MDGRNDLVERLYYWTDDESGYDQHYRSSNIKDDEKIIQIKRLNFFIGRNNSGKSRFLRGCFRAEKSPRHFTPMQNWLDDATTKLDMALNQHKLGEDSSTLAFETVTSTRWNHIPITELQTMVNQAKTQLLESANCYRSNGNLNGFHFCSPNLKMVNSLSALTPKHPEKINFFKEILSYLTEYENNFTDKIESLDFRKSFYTPTLRGLRPTQPHNAASQTPYADRTQKDYFISTSKQNIITGENLYTKLTQDLLGEPEGRNHVRAYEQALSQYFFDGATISLIPKYGEDTINIKIGEDHQRSVTQLGDGLQQVLILTYEAFLKKDQRCAFFIEEPELHMHAGMLRQLMNFYLNETDHFYFFTTHSNHLVDMVDESSEVMIQKFQKRQDPETQKPYFQVDQCDRDRDLLAQLGVRPSSVYLSNCTIWIEGITDRLYIHRYMQRYLQDLKDEKSALYAKYQRFMPNYHYSFVEYQGGNLTHWNFDPKTAQDCDKNGGLNANWVCSNALLIADGDIKGKSDRVDILEEQLGERFYLLECKEIENTLPTNLIVSTAIARFNRMNGATKQGIDISPVESITEPDFFFDSKDGIGRLLDRKLGKTKKYALFQDESGTIKHKLKFCQDIIKMMDKPDCEWQLTDSAKALCERIFRHIADQNP